MINLNLLFKLTVCIDNIPTHYIKGTVLCTLALEADIGHEVESHAI